MHLIPQWDQTPTPLQHTWAPLGNVDQFRWLSRGDMQKQLQMARDELGVRHVRACAMYAPQNYVWDHPLNQWKTPAEEKTRQANWQLLDLSLEALLELGLKPIYTTCFTPEGMTQDPTLCWPDNNRTGMPDDLAQWQDFVSSGIRHHIQRYGREEVRSWFFECWNEPNLRGCFFGGSKEDFFRLWSATWHAVKSVDPELRFGGPSTARGEWMEDFLDFTAQDGTPPDYLITHVYNMDSNEEPLSPFDGPAADKVKDSPHFAAGVIRGLQSLVKEKGFTGEVHWNEWGRSWFPQDFTRHTALDAAFIVKTMAEVSQCADYFAYWCLSDLYNQGGLQTAELDGHYGMLSLHGLRKPTWFAHQLLNRLGTQSVPVTGGDALTSALATRSEGKAHILVYAYPAQSEANTSVTDMRVTLPTGAHNLQLTRLGQHENNVHAQWEALGAPAYPTPAQVQDLRKTNQLQTAEGDAIVVQDNVATFRLETPGVALLECDLA